MRNLNLCNHVNHILNKEYFAHEFCCNIIDKGKYLFCKQTNSKDNENAIIKVVGSTENLEFIFPSNSAIISFEYVTSIGCFCIISSDGDVAFFKNEQNGQIEIVGSFEDGIKAACWSPDHELLCIVTGTLNLVVLVPSFEGFGEEVSLDPVAEVPLEQDDFGQNKFINVGWGKKETQFHGSEGKDAAKRKKIITHKALDFDDKLPRITWRGDGQLFAVSYISNVTEARKFRVLNRESSILYTSEEVEGFEQAFSWKPSGSLIASSQRLSNRHNIIFFEKNGLQHGNFALPFEPNEMVVKELLWNSDSSVLLVFAQSQNESKKTVLQLWTMGNYHWYLKEELRFEENVKRVLWDTNSCYTLYVFTESHLHEFEFLFTTDKSLGLSQNDLAQVSVIDGKKLLITPFRQTIVPPPISAYEIHLPDQIHSVIYAPSSIPKKHQEDCSLVEDSGYIEIVDPPGLDSNNICVFHGLKSLSFIISVNINEVDEKDIKSVIGLGGNGVASKTKIHRILTTIQLPLTDDQIMPGCLYNWLWLSKSVLICCLVNQSGHQLLTLDLENLGTEEEKIGIRNLTQLEGPCLAVSGSANGTTICLQFDSEKDKKIIFFDLVDNPSQWISRDSSTDLFMPALKDRLRLCSFDSSNSHLLPLGLSNSNCLYLGSTKLLSDCTSMHFHSDHLILTTTSHSLIVVPLDLNILLSLADKKDSWENVGVRKLERGSRIVTSISNDTKVVLQMPRGNIEMVSPRPLVVHTLKRLLDDLIYHTAVDIMRRNRIDMNLIFDHNPVEFINNVDIFVKNVNNPHWIDLFIANLNDEDVTTTAYARNYERSPEYVVKMKEIFSSKIEKVSLALRKSMLNIDKDHFLLSILTTYVKSPKGEMHLALLMLKEIRSCGDGQSAFDAGLKHLAYVADVNELCDVALGTYDFELVMIVYAKSQKDPKEYLPFLNSLKRLTGDYQKFKINVHLKLFKKSLQCLQHCEEHNEECLALIKKENLYLDAIRIFPITSTLYKESCNAYGDYLCQKGYENEAGAMYTRGQNYQSALDTYVGANNWRRALMTAFKMKLSKSEVANLCQTLTEQLIAKELYMDAALLYEKYVKSDEDAVECYVKAAQWEEAFLLANRNCREDLILTIIKPSLVAQFEDFKQEIKTKLETFFQYFYRLLIVRQNKFNQHLSFLEDGDCELDPDLCSDSSTVTGFSHRKSNASRSSGTSGRSYRSSKNRRKLDRKKYSTKEGSNFEDVGIVAALHEIYTGVDILATNVSDLNRVFLSMGEDQNAMELQNLLSNLIQEILRKKFEVWVNCAPLPDEGALEFGPEMTVESAVQGMQGAALKKATFVIQRMEELEPHLRFPPKLENVSSWKLYALK